jgi:hypothetical protein
VFVELILACRSQPAVAQTRDVLELQLGGGYVVGGGAEDPGPSLPTHDVGIAVWLTEHWGVAARRVVGPGEDIRDSPIVGRDRIFAGKGNLKYSTVTARYRRFFLGEIELNIGFGLAMQGTFEGVQFLLRPGEPPRRITPETRFGGFALEVLLGHKFSRHFGAKGGFTEDFSFETSNFHPVGLGVISF